MSIKVEYPGGMRVDAVLSDHVIHTDQPARNGGENTAPSPFDLFLASLATCAGIFVLFFCRKRGIPSEGIDVSQRVERDPDTGMLSLVEVSIELPPEFPDKYRSAVVRAAEQCAVKKHLENPPELKVVLLEGRAGVAVASNDSTR